MKISRRTFIAGGLVGAAGLLSAPAIFSHGTTGFLRSALADHFGAHVLKLNGVDAFVEDYANQAGSASPIKKLAAEIYFRYGGPTLVPTSGARNLRETFLKTILTRSNIIAIEQGRAKEFEYAEVNPYQNTCGIYLSARAEDG